MYKYLDVNLPKAKKKVGFKIAVLLLAVIIAAVSTSAQQESGQISGNVKDANDAVIPGATLTVKNTATNSTRVVTTNDEGFYSVSNLQPGTYSITASKQGFAEAQENVQVTVGGRITVNLTAGVQNVQAETVDVNIGGGAEINTTDQQLSTTVTGKQIQSLPTLNRNPYALVNLSGNISTGDPSGRGAGVAINGLRAASTSILLDGAENSDIFTAGIAQTTPLESVGEFQVITSNFSAEYGRASAGIVNVSTRAGTNRLTGNVFAFNRNSALGANSFDNNAKGTERPFYNRNQFGYLISGPIVKDKLFFSNSTEWTIIRSTAAVFAYIPTQSFINSSNINTRNFFAAYGKLRSDVVNIGNPVAVGGSATPNFQLVSYNAPINAGGGTPQDTYSTVTRVDYNVNDKTQMYLRYAQERPKFLDGTGANSPYAGYDTGQTDLRHNVMLNLSRTFTNNFVSNTKAAFRRTKTSISLVNPLDTPSLYTTSIASSFAGDLIALPGYLPFNPGSGVSGDETQSLFQLNQDLNYVAGKHIFKFGGQYVFIRDNNGFPAYKNAALTLGSTVANAVTNLRNGQLFQLQAAVDPQGKFPGQTVNLPVKSPNFVRDNRYNEFALYFTDAWRVIPRLTLNLGLRYEYYGVQKSKSGQDANFYFGTGSTIQERIRNGSVAMASQKGGLWQPDKNNFAPRVGFAYDVFGDGTTSIRGGYGMAFERNFGNVTFNVIQNPPYYAVLSIFASDVGGNLPLSTANFGPLAGSTGSSVLPRTSLRHVREDIVNAYAHFYSLAFEREVLKDTAARVEYSGSAGRSLYSIENINRSGTGTKYLSSNNASVCPTTFAANDRLNCQYSSINSRGNSGYSNYNSLSLSLAGNNFRNSGLGFTARYTYAVSKDNLSSTFSEAANNFNLGFTDPFDPKYDYGYADFDIRHRFVASFNYDIPFAKTLSSGFAKTLLDGFSLNGILTANTGTPFTVYDCTNAITTCLRIKPTGSLSFKSHAPSGSAGANVFTYLDLTGQTSNPFTDGVTGGTEVGPFPNDVSRRNAFRAPGGWNVDLGFIKNLRFTERYSLQLRGELINAFNMTDFVVLGSSAELTGGTVQATKTGSGPGGTQRTIQLSAKFIF